VQGQTKQCKAKLNSAMSNQTVQGQTKQCNVKLNSAVLN